MDLDELRCFLAVVDAGSILGASTQLGVPRGTVRRRVDELEARVGVRLLARSARGVAITDAGAMVARRGRELLKGGAALLHAVREFGREPQGWLRVHVPVGMPPSLMVAFREFFYACAPDMRLFIQVSDAPLDGLHRNGGLALHFTERAHSGPWVVTPLAPLSVQIVASPKYLQRVGCPQAVADLAHHKLVSWTVPGQAEDRWPLRGGGHIEVAPIMNSNDIHMLREQANMEIGLVLLPQPPVNLLGLPVDDLVTVLDGVVGVDIELSLFLPDAIASNPRAMRFVALIQAFVARMKQARAIDP